MVGRGNEGRSDSEDKRKDEKSTDHGCSFLNKHCDVADGEATPKANALLPFERSRTWRSTFSRLSYEDLRVEDVRFADL